MVGQCSVADALLGGIIINEILVDPNGALNFDTDGNGTAHETDEYVELFNASGSAIDISGLQLWDQGIGNWFTFPSGTILQAGGHAMVMTGVQAGGTLPTGNPGDLFFSAGRGAALINNGGDNVTLYDPANNQFIQATFNGVPLDTPTLGGGGYTGFPSTATRVGLGENFGNDTDGQSLQRTSDGTNNFTSDTPTPGTTNVCFADGTCLATPTGQQPVEMLRQGDLVVTADHGARRITWVYSKTWTVAQMQAAPNLLPALIYKDALGRGLPDRDLRLSQQHRVLVQGPIAKRMFGTSEVLIPAVSLLPLAGVLLDSPTQDVTYYHVMLDRHEVVYANALPTESLFLGKQALCSIPQRALDEICTLLDILPTDLGTTSGPVTPARPFVKGKQAVKLVQRHDKNNRALVAQSARLH